ncbi:MAG: hypothetical protein N2487_02705 [Verrucomicrobiae bacterium]|nr:hypothetical protein [Verrucomicrobiae bacterium]
MNSNHDDSLLNRGEDGIESEVDGHVRNRTPEEESIYRSKLSREIEKHKEELLMLKFDEELLKKQLRDMFKDGNE